MHQPSWQATYAARYNERVAIERPEPIGFYAPTVNGYRTFAPDSAVGRLNEAVASLGRGLGSWHRNATQLHWAPDQRPTERP